MTKTISQLKTVIFIHLAIILSRHNYNLEKSLLSQNLNYKTNLNGDYVQENRNTNPNCLKFDLPASINNQKCYNDTDKIPPTDYIEYNFKRKGNVCCKNIKKIDIPTPKKCPETINKCKVRCKVKKCKNKEDPCEKCCKILCEKCKSKRKKSSSEKICDDESKKKRNQNKEDEDDDDEDEEDSLESDKDNENSKRNRIKKEDDDENDEDLDKEKDSQKDNKKHKKSKKKGTKKDNKDEEDENLINEKDNLKNKKANKKSKKD